MKLFLSQKEAVMLLQSGVLEIVIERDKAPAADVRVEVLPPKVKSSPSLDRGSTVVGKLKPVVDGRKVWSAERRAAQSARMKKSRGGRKAASVHVPDVPYSMVDKKRDEEYMRRARDELGVRSVDESESEDDGLFLIGAVRGRHGNL